MKTRILVVDDDRLVADTLSLIYNANGYDSVACYSAAEGFAQAHAFLPQVVLCDITMPGENGLQLASRLQQAMPELRMLMLTAYTSNAALANAESQRIGRPLKVFSKPLRPDDLLRETQSALEAS